MKIMGGIKATGLAALAGLGVSGTASNAAATTYGHCDWDGDRCVRVHCDWDGDDCWRESVYYRPHYYGDRRWVCDWEGDDCHWVYSHGPYYRGYYYRPRFGFDFRL